MEEEGYCCYFPSLTHPITLEPYIYSSYPTQLFYSAWATIAFFQLFEHYENRNTALHHHHIMVDLVWEGRRSEMDITIVFFMK